MTASGRGGQPGTYTSTGRIMESTPCTTAYESYMPPDEEHTPMAITHFGSGIWS